MTKTTIKQLKEKGYKLHSKKTDDFSESQWSTFLSKNHVEVRGNKAVYYIKKHQNKRINKKVSIKERVPTPTVGILILLMLYYFISSWAYIIAHLNNYGYFYSRSYYGALEDEIDINLSPVRFTEKELTDFYNSVEAQRIEYQLDYDPVRIAIWKATQEYDVDYNLALAVAKCESGFRPDAQNGSSTAGGLYQFIDGTWLSTMRAMGEQQTTRTKYNADMNARAFAYKIGVENGLHHWNASRGCWSHLVSNY